MKILPLKGATIGKTFVYMFGDMMYNILLNKRTLCHDRQWGGGLLASSLFQSQDHQNVDTTKVLFAICQTCQSCKPLSDNRTTHPHRGDFDFLARLSSSSGLSPALWRRLGTQQR